MACAQVVVLLLLRVHMYKRYFSTGAVFLMKDLHLQLASLDKQLPQSPMGDFCSCSSAASSRCALQRLGTVQLSSLHLCSPHEWCCSRHQEQLLCVASIGRSVLASEAHKVQDSVTVLAAA